MKIKELELFFNELQQVKKDVDMCISYEDSKDKLQEMKNRCREITKNIDRIKDEYLKEFESMSSLECEVDRDIFTKAWMLYEKEKEKDKK